MLHTSRTSRSYRALPDYQKRAVLRLYHACADTLGNEPSERRRAFVKLLYLYFPFYGAADLQSAYDVVRRHEETRTQAARVRRLYGAYGHRLVRLFGRWDADGDGVVSLPEFRMALERTTLSRREIDRLFAHADADHNGELSLEELVRFFAQNEALLASLETAVRSAEERDDRAREERLSMVFPSDVAARLHRTRARPSLVDVRPMSQQTDYLRAHPRVWM